MPRAVLLTGRFAARFVTTAVMVVGLAVTTGCGDTSSAPTNPQATTPAAGDQPVGGPSQPVKKGGRTPK